MFTRALESLKIGTMMASFCLKLKMYELKIYREIMCHDNEEWCKNWREIDFVSSKMTWGIWHEHSKISKICTLMGCFWPKYMFELKKYRGVMFDGTEDWCKVWRKIDLSFLKWHKEFGKFSFAGWKIANFILESKRQN